MTKFAIFGALTAIIFSWWFLRDQEVVPIELKSKNEEIVKIKTDDKVKSELVTPAKIIPNEERVILKPQVQNQKFKRADSHTILGDQEGNILLEEAQIVEDGLVYQNDLFIEEHYLVKDYLKANRNKAIKIPKPEKWPEPMIPFTFDPSFNYESNALNAMEYMEKNTKIRFRRAAEKDEYYVRFVGGWNDNCYSFLGRVKRERGQSIALGPSCGVREIVHELMHVLGFIHEQSRHDRDEYITINWENIEEINHQQFSKFPQEFVDMSNYTFDFKSIMLYPPTTFSKFPEDYSITTINGEPYPTPQEILSPQDIKRVNDLYPD